jgi:hypothetical protein
MTTHPAIRDALASSDDERAILRSIVAEIREGLRRPTPFVDRPPVLPAERGALVRLLASKAAADGALRAETLAWIEDCRRAAVDTASALRPLVLAVRLADRLVATHAGAKDEEEIWKERGEIIAYTTLVFHVDVTKAPWGAELDDWCLQQANRGNPAPAIRIAASSLDDQRARVRADA